MAVKPVIIPLVADTTGLQPGIDALEELGKIDKDSAAKFREANKAFQERGKVLDQSVTSTDKFAASTKKMAESITGGAINQAAANIDKITKSLNGGSGGAKIFADAIAKAKEQLSSLPAGSSSFGQLKDEIDAATKAFEQLNTGTKNPIERLNELKATLESLRNAGLDQTQLFKALEGETNSLSNSIDNAGEEYKRLLQVIQLAKKQLSTFDEGTKEFDKLSSEIEAAEMAMGNFSQEATSSRAQLRQYREALIQLEEAGMEGTDVFNDLALAAAQLDDQIGDTQTRIRTLASDTFKFDAAIQAIQGVAGAFSIAQGATALFGKESEDVQRALLKVTATMSVLNGLQQLQNILQRQSAATLFVENALRRISAASTVLQSLAESRFVVVRVAATAAQNALNAAMAANPAGILLLAISAAAGALLLFSNNSEEAADSQEKLADASQKVVEALNEEMEIQERLRNTRVGGLNTIRQEIAELQARGAARSKILSLEQRAIGEEIQNLRIRQQTLAEEAATQKEFEQIGEQIVQLRQERRIKEIEQQKAAADEGLEITRKAQEEERKAIQAFLRDQVAANEAAVIEATNGFERLVAQIALINAKLRQELANPDLGPNERLAAELRAGEEIRKARQDLLGDLEQLGRDHNTRLTKIDRERILEGSKNAQEELEQKRQNAEEQLKIVQQRVEREKELEARRLEFSIQVASSLAGSITEIYRNNADAQIAIEQQRLEQGLITQEQFDQKSRAIRRKAAQDEKQLALFQAALAQSLAILSILKDQTIPVTAKPLFIALASAQAIAQLAAIASKPIPAFAKGTKNAPGGLSLIGEAGPELYHANGKWGYANKATLLDLPKGAKVIPTLETEKILQKYQIPVPNVPNVNTPQGSMKIDYNKLGSVIGREIGKLPLQVNSWDGRGFNQYQTSISSRRAHLNTKFSSK